MVELGADIMLSSSSFLIFPKKSLAGLSAAKLIEADVFLTGAQ